MSGALQNVGDDRSGPHTRGCAFKIVLNGSRVIRPIAKNTRLVSLINAGFRTKKTGPKTRETGALGNTGFT